MALWDSFTNAVGNVVNTAKNAVSSVNSAAKKAVDTAAKTVQNAQTATKTAVKTATKNALNSATNAGKSVSQNIADIARGKTTSSANGTWSIATATGATAGALGGIASGVKTATTNAAEYIMKNYNTSSKNGISNAADAILTDVSWEPVYVSNSKDGSKNTQTWVNTYTGDQTAFGGISASALSDYYEEKGDTRNAQIMDSIARASTRYDSLNTAGYRYDNMGSIGSVLGVSSSPASSLYGTSGTPTASTPKESSKALSSVLSVANNVLDARGTIYDSMGSELSKGNFASGQVVGGVATLGADVMLPLDIVNVVTKVASGRADELSGWDYAYAGLDAVAAAAGLLTGGLGYVGLKGAKTALKSTKALNTVKNASYAGQIVTMGAESVAGGI